MPPAYLADKRGKPLLSWRVALLPYLGQAGPLQAVPPGRALGQPT